MADVATGKDTAGEPCHVRHRLAWLDQLAFELFRATGRSQLMQCLCLYDRDVDLSALERMNERLAALSFNRLIEPSPLPLARPRWVMPAGVPVPLRSSPDVLPRSQLLHWANRQARLPVQPVTGPAWRMAVQRFDDASTAVSIVGSHLVIDGMGALRAIEAAANGTDLPGSYMPQGGRGWPAGCLSDALQIFADAPRTVAALARVARASWRSSTPSAPGPAVRFADQGASRHEVVDIPSVAVTVGARAWHECARRLGGRSITLLPGFVASLAAHLGRIRPSDGAVSLLVPVDRRRGLDDDRALAIEFHSMLLAPQGLAMDLRPVNAPLKALLRAAREIRTDPLSSLLPAVAWLPRAASTALVNRLFTYGDAVPVSCSNLGTLPDGLARIDGAPCDRVLTRAVDVNVTRRDLQRSNGHLVVVASRYGEVLSLCIEACQLSPTLTTTEELRRVTSMTLADFGLDASIEA